MDYLFSFLGITDFLGVPGAFHQNFHFRVYIESDFLLSSRVHVFWQPQKWIDQLWVSLWRRHQPSPHLLVCWIKAILLVIACWHVIWWSKIASGNWNPSSISFLIVLWNNPLSPKIWFRVFITYNIKVRFFTNRHWTTNFHRGNH